MATITSAQSGNFSSTSTWVGGVVPTVGDIAVAATGHVVAIDVDTTVDKVTQAGTGKFTLGNGRTLTAEVEANAGTFTSGGTVEVTATSGNTAYIVGNVTGVSSTAVNVCAVNVTGVGTLDLTGSVTGSAGNASSEANGHAGVYTNVTCTITINGDVSGGTGFHKRGVQVGVSSNATITATSTTIQGGGGSAYGVYAQGASATITATSTTIQGGIGVNAMGVLASGASATITATSTTIQGGGGSGAVGVYAQGASATVNSIGEAIGASTLSHGIRCDATANGVIHEGDMTDSLQGAVAIYTRIFRMSATNSGVTTYTNTVGYPNGTPVSRVSPDNVIGMPATSNVRKNTIYGYNNELTGAMAVPSASSVAYGVPVDNTLGTAEFDLGRAAEIIGLQVAAGKSV